MIDILKDTLLDTLKLIPFLVITFILIEYLEHKASKKSMELISKSKKFGPLIGGILGATPQCGLGVMATNLYVTRIISIGTLIAIFLSTSDEMLPVLISNGMPLFEIIKILVIKIIIGVSMGFLIDSLFFKNKRKEKINIEELCEDEHCHCDDENFFISALEHTLKTILFIFIFTLILNFIIYFIGEDYIEKLMLNNKFIAPFISSIIGLIPNCAGSVIITELYIKQAISFGTMMSGLLTGSGIAIIILFRNNKNFKENCYITAMLFFIGILFGIIFNILI